MKKDQSNDQAEGEFENPFRGILVVGTIGTGKTASISLRIAKIKKGNSRSNDTTKS